MQATLVAFLTLGLPMAAQGRDEPLNWFAHQQLRRDVLGMTTAWGIGGPVERRSGSAERVKRVGPKAVPSLLLMLEDRDPLVRSGAMCALEFFPERAAQSVPPLLRILQRSEERFVLQGAGVTLQKLLPRDKPPPADLVGLLASDMAYRRMIATDLVLRCQPQHQQAQQALLLALRWVPQPRRDEMSGLPTLPNEFWSSETGLVVAWHAILTLEALPADQRRFAQAEVDRIAGFSFEETERFGELHRLCEYVRTLRAGKGK